jgi:hypothetical protein
MEQQFRHLGPRRIYRDDLEIREEEPIVANAQSEAQRRSEQVIGKRSPAPALPPYRHSILREIALALFSGKERFRARRRNRLIL